MVTRAATTTSWTMIRMRVGIVLRIMDIMTFANAVITVTASPMTIAGFNCDVTARAEQIPRTCTRTGLFPFSGVRKTSRFSLDNSFIAYRFFRDRSERRSDDVSHRQSAPVA